MVWWTPSNMNKEIKWEFIPMFDNRYMISESGEVIRCAKPSSYKLVLKQHLNPSKSSYFVSLLQPDGKTNRYDVARLVLMTYDPTYVDNSKIIHIDGNPKNNYIKNLRWEEPIKNLPGELWKVVPDTENTIFVSNKGRVKRVRVEGSREIDHILTPFNDIYGYKVAHWSVKGVLKSQAVHRLVAKLFIPNIDNKPDVNHINGIKTDNYVENLEWVTKVENMRHAVKLGLCRNDSELMKQVNRERMSKAIICVETSQEFNSIKDAAKFYNVSVDCISGILHKKNKYGSKRLPGITFEFL